LYLKFDFLTVLHQNIISITDLKRDSILMLVYLAALYRLSRIHSIQTRTEICIIIWKMCPRETGLFFR